MERKKFILASMLSLAAAFLLVLAAVGCGNGTASGSDLSGSLSLSGSTTVLPIAQEAADMFMENYPKVTVNVQGGGSSVGISNVAEGIVDVGDSSRELNNDESSKGLVDHKIAYDVIVVITNKNVPVENLSADQVKGIFTGTIKNWQEVGGPDAPITVVVRDSSSGTREMFDEKALQKQKPLSGAIETNSNGIMRQTISSTPNAIGYVSLGYADGSVKLLDYGGVAGNQANALNGSYPLSRYLHMFTKGEPSDLAKAFIDYVLSNDFQNQVVSKEYIPITEAKS